MSAAILRASISLCLQSGIALGLRGGIAFEVEAKTVDMDLHSGECRKYEHHMLLCS